MDSTWIPRIPAATARKLGYYVYLYVDPTDRSVFYVGKGKNGRAQNPIAYVNVPRHRRLESRAPR
ncbi:MAG TPA: hypothetical protein VNI83_13960 [Vicinamibacterales bacterium]|nr:hypothetical protein [Vicinamibacterales bacterium]